MLPQLGCDRRQRGQEFGRDGSAGHCQAGRDVRHRAVRQMRAGHRPGRAAELLYEVVQPVLGRPLRLVPEIESEVDHQLGSTQLGLP
ncbi:hypothetical protein [Catellatospora chokoriensis]|uniref:Uncharacterized protein n=1 Tax=Catellatospora chokoriensis TaxID=310353 RepID=A0A8J3KFD2_9ACTN|nr:hypothetical protein [Catellatospora chokoriensis]GIF94879.1 hypothetical protein Cch02nite_83230 [Catellatospora chokoriensis]